MEPHIQFVIDAMRRSADASGLAGTPGPWRPPPRNRPADRQRLCRVSRYSEVRHVVF